MTAPLGAFTKAVFLTSDQHLKILCFIIGATLSSLPALAAPSGIDSKFRFESVVSLEEMDALIRERLPLGTSRDRMRQFFVKDGGASLKLKPGDSHVEKYLYDIDLCSYYIWRWNISADYDGTGALRQAYVNGNPVFLDGNKKKVVSKVAAPGKNASISKAQRPRPEAYKGERSLAFILFDRDSDPGTTDDQALIGAGPSRADPINMGKRVSYSDVEPWRSIFDADAADRIVPYPGDCKAVDEKMDRQRRAD